ncbi:MAG TPA: DnaJ domain-containing protein [Stellaceae bacterium]|nr:DnaJ domain-containing protein [Stellaceae bacterium]
MIFLIGGIAILCGVLLLGYLFVHADPARLARNLRWIGIAALAAATLALLVLTEGRLFMLLVPAAFLWPAWRRLRSMMGGFSGGPQTGQNSTVETPFIRMSLDHDTGAMAGTVLQGHFAGMRLDELRPPELLALLRECRAADEEGARLIEAYLDRVRSNWHDEMASDWGRSESRQATPDVTVDEAYAILGLQPGADEEAIKAAHHRLMKLFHPDHGGSDYFAAKINRARDVLLRRQRA